MNTLVMRFVKNFINKTKNLSVKQHHCSKNCYFIKLPVAIGDCVYVINYALWEIKLIRIESILLGNLENGMLGVLSFVADDGEFYECGVNEDGSYTWEASEVFSELFKTRKEAEKALREKEKDYFDSLTPEEREEELVILKHRKQVVKEGIERMNNIFQRGLS